MNNLQLNYHTVAAPPELKKNTATLVFDSQTEFSSLPFEIRKPMGALLAALNWNELRQIEKRYSEATIEKLHRYKGNIRHHLELFLNAPDHPEAIKTEIKEFVETKIGELNRESRQFATGQLEDNHELILPADYDYIADSAPENFDQFSAN